MDAMTSNRIARVAAQASVPTVWTLSVDGDLEGVFDSEEKALQARSHLLATRLEKTQFTVASIGRWTVR